MEEFVLFLLQIVGELILNLLMTALFEVSVEKISRSKKKWQVLEKIGWGNKKRLHNLSKAGASFGYAACGCVLGLVSLGIVPVHLIRLPWLRTLNLCVTPIAIGILMGIRRRQLVKMRRVAIRQAGFLNGYVFALMFAAIRFHFAQ